MFQTKSGSRFIATIAATVIGAVLITAGSAQAAVPSKYTSTDEFLRNSFVHGQFVEGFTPGKADWGFSLEALLQRAALGESKAQLQPAVKYLLENRANSGTTLNYTGYLFSAGKLNLGQLGKWAFASKVLGANNGSSRLSLLKAAVGTLDKTGDIAASSDANTYDRAWLVLGLKANGYGKPALGLATAILGHQLQDGGWDDGYTLGESSPDGTGIVLQALVAAKSLAVGTALKNIKKGIAAGVAYLKGSLVNGDHYESWGDYNINGTEYAQLGLDAAGAGSAPIAAWLASKLSTDGGLQTPWSGGAGDVYATAQGAIALMGSSYVALLK